MEKEDNKKARFILWTLILLYLAAVLLLTIFRGVDTRARTLNLIPFATLMEQIEAVFSEFSIFALANLMGNFVLFFPFGYFLALQFPKMRKKSRLFLLFFLATSAIEILQYVLNCGATDIDDLILNVLGGMAGYVAYLSLSNRQLSDKNLIDIGIAIVAVTGIPYWLAVFQ